ncbi:MAG: tetratricopeptide repeat protein, partial [Patescibacteria group bacterium]
MKNNIEKEILYTNRAAKIYKETNQDSLLCNSMDNLGYLYYANSDFASAAQSFKSCLPCFSKAKDKNDLVQLLNMIGASYYQMSELDLAATSFQKAIDIAQQIDDQDVAAQAYINLGNVYSEKGSYELAVNAYQLSLRIRMKQENDEGISKCLNNIGALYQEIGRYGIAKKYLWKSIQIRKRIDDKHGIASTLANFGCIYEKENNLDTALMFYESSVKLFTELDEKAEMAGGLYNIGNLLLAKKDIPNAEKYGLQALKLCQETENQGVLANVLILLGEIAFEKKDYASSIRLLNSSLEISERIMYAANIANASKALYGSYKATGNYKEALESFLRYQTMRDSTNAVEVQKNLVDIQTKYQTEVNQKEIEVLNQQKVVNESEIKRQRLIKNSFIIGFVLLLLLSFATYSLYASKRKSHRKLEAQNALISAKNEEIALQKDELAGVNQRLLSLNSELEKLSIVASETDNSVMIMDKDGNFEWGNRGFEKLLQTTLEEYKLKHGDSILTASASKEIKSLVAQCMDSGKS